MVKKLGALAVVLALGVLWLQREEARGTFTGVERHFTSWLAANAGVTTLLPPLTLVLYDQEASEMSGQSRMTTLDATLFVRAALRLGAVAAGIEGLEGNPVRMLEAAHEMPVFGGYDVNHPPSLGWTALTGESRISWLELRGLVDARDGFSRGFIAPPLPGAGPREIALMARSTERPVPSMLLLAWVAAQGRSVGDLTISKNRVALHDRVLPMDAEGRFCFWPAGVSAKITMNEMLVAAEKFERTGGESPLRGRVVVLVAATPDVVRLTREGGATTLPAELWAQAWEPLRTEQLFIAAGLWFSPLLWLSSWILAFCASRVSRQSALIVWTVAIMVYLLVALGAYAGSTLFLPLVPAFILFSAAVMAGQLLQRLHFYETHQSHTSTRNRS